MWIVETENVRFNEDDVISGSLEPGKVKIQEVRVEIPSFITSFQIVVHVVVDYVNNPQEEQINDVITNELVTEGLQEIELWRSITQRRLAISNDYVVYLHESEFDLSINNDSVLFSWAMKEELKLMNDNEV